MEFSKYKKNCHDKETKNFETGFILESVHLSTVVSQNVKILKTF